MKKALVIVLLFVGIGAFAQDKQMKKNNIKSVTETFFDYSSGVEVKYVESEEIYDQNGDLIEIKDNKGGKFVLHEKYSYDLAGNKIKEVRYDSKGKIERIVEYKYQGKLKTERIDYFPNGKVRSRKLYTYTTHE